MKADILAIAAHPDDIELACSGTLFKHVQNGYKVVVVDLTEGELGTRGTPEIRLREAQDSAKILGLAERLNLGLADGFFENDTAHLIPVVEQIRKYRPEIIVTNSLEDRHPDHARAGDLVSRASFLAGLRKLETDFHGETQEAWRPKAVYRFIQDRWIDPDLVVDVSDKWETKMKSIMAFKSQFYDPNSEEPSSPISSKEFLDFLEGRAREFGRIIGVEFGEGFNVERSPGVDDLLSLK